MFETGNLIVYGSYGVCRIIGTEENDLSGEALRYFVLKPLFDENATVYVPQNNPVLLDRMRALITKEAVEEMLRSLPEEVDVWIDDEIKRKQSYQKMLVRGEPKEMLRLIKTLYYHEQEQKEKGRRLHISDEAVLRQAKELLCHEMACVLDVSPQEVEERLQCQKI